MLPNDVTAVGAVDDQHNYPTRQKGALHVPVAKHMATTKSIREYLYITLHIPTYQLNSAYLHVNRV